MNSTFGSVAKRINATELVMFGGSYQIAYLKENLGHRRNAFKLFYEKIREYMNYILHISFLPEETLPFRAVGKRCVDGSEEEKCTQPCH